MAAIQPGTKAPSIRGISFKRAPLVVVFYKVTCEVCQLAAPAFQRFHELFPGRIFGVGQNPPPRLEEWTEEHKWGFPSVHDLSPWPASTAYGVEVTPTTFLIGPGDREILDTVESWDRLGINRIARRLAQLAGGEYVPISEMGDGLPEFRPG